MLTADFGRPFGIGFVLRGSQRVIGQFAVFLAQGLNDVVAVVGVDRFADLTRFKGESGIFEFLDHLTAGEPAKGAAVVFVGGVQGVCGGEFGPVGAVIQLINEILGLFFGLDQNVVGVDHFGFKHTAFDGFVEQSVLEEDVLGVIVQEVVAEGAVVAHFGDILNVGLEFGKAVVIVFQIGGLEVVGLQSERLSGTVIDGIGITEHFLQSRGDGGVFDDDALLLGFGFEDLVVNKLVDDFIREGFFAVFAELAFDLFIQGVKRQTVHLVHLSVLLILADVLVAVEDSKFLNLSQGDRIAVHGGDHGVRGSGCVNSFLNSGFGLNFFGSFFNSSFGLGFINSIFNSGLGFGFVNSLFNFGGSGGFLNLVNQGFNSGFGLGFFNSGFRFGFLDGIADSLDNVFRGGVFNSVGDFVDGFLNSGGGFVKRGFGFVSGVFRGGFKLVSGLFGSIGDLIDGLFRGGGGFVNSGLGFVSGVFRGGLKLVSGIFGSGGGFVKRGFGFVSGFLCGFFKLGGSFINGGFDLRGGFFGRGGFLAAGEGGNECKRNQQYGNDFFVERHFIVPLFIKI